MFTGLSCWSSHLPAGQGILILISIHQDATALSPLLTFSLTTSTIFFILEYTPLVMLKAQYPSMESVLIPILGYVKKSFSAHTLTELIAVHFSSWNCTPVPFPRIQYYFSITQLKNPNCIINWNVSTSNSTSTSTGWMM